MTARRPSPPLPLIAHGNAPTGAAWQVTVSWSWSQQQLQLDYWINGDGAKLRWPPPQTPQVADALWQHSCAEAFIAAEGADAYHEYNFSPCGRWARYRFSDQRQRDRDAEQSAAPCPLHITTQRQANRSGISVAVPLSDLPHSSEGWRVGLCVVIEHVQGTLSYWALTHPCKRPDFHHPGGRVLRLPPP